MRILMAGILGGIAMFVWTSIAHMATPLGTTGFSQMQDEAKVLEGLQAGVGSKPGLYIFPWIDPADPNMEQAFAEKQKTSPSGYFVYRPAGQGMMMTPALLATEFAKQTVQALIAAYLLSLSTVAMYLMRVAFVGLIHVSAAVATNVSYWNWYGYPTDYTVAQIVIEVVAGLSAGLVIAWLIRPRSA